MDPQRLVSFINVVEFGTDPSSGIRQNRRQAIEPLTSRPIRGSKNGTNGARNAGSSSKASTLASSSGSRNSCSGRTDSNNDG